MKSGTFNSFLCFSLFVTMFLNGCSATPSPDTQPKKVVVESVKTQLEKKPNWRRKPPSELSNPVPVPPETQIDPNRKLVEWKAKGFVGKEQLVNTWSKKIECNEYWLITPVFAYPIGWGIGECYIIDPITGMAPKYEELEDDSQFAITEPGITDGEYVFGCLAHKRLYGILLASQGSENDVG